VFALAQNELTRPALYALYLWEYMGLALIVVIVEAELGQQLAVLPPHSVQARRRCRHLGRTRGLWKGNLRRRWKRFKLVVGVGVE
jgi:hypothetical protein